MIDVEPLIVSELGRMLPLPQGGRADWADVLERAGVARARRRQRLPRRFAFAITSVAVLAALVTAVAFGWPQTIIHFFSAPPAPQKVKNFFGAQNVAAPAGMSPEAIPGEARKITTAAFDASGVHPDHPTRHTLYIAPRRGGGFCFEWSDAFGSCSDAKNSTASAKTHPATRPLGILWLGNDYPLVVGGWVRSGAAKTVEARFADGTTTTLPVTWVSAPISAGFVIYSVPAVHRTRADALTSVVALDATGKAIAEQAFPLTKPLDEDIPLTLPDGTKISLSRRAEVATARKIISFRATDGSKVWLWVMNRRGGGVCFAFNQGEGCPPPSSLARGPAFSGGTASGGKRVLFFGQSKPDVATIELRYQNGGSEQLQPIDGFVLHEITPAHYKPGTRLVAAIAFDNTGRPLATEHFKPGEIGVYPCQKPTNLGYGAKACR